MRIAIDARLNAYRQGGIPQYTRQLMTALAEVARDDTIISLQHRDHQRPLVVAHNVRRQTVLTPPHHRLEQWTLPLEAMLARPDLLHTPDFIAPRRRPFPAVVTIHDLAFMHYPQILDDAGRAYYSQVKASALAANAIIAVSEATRQDVAQLLDVPLEQIDVIHEAAAPIYGRIELRPGEVRVLDGTPVAAGTFMLFVSTLEPRKNLPTLLRALRTAIDRAPDAGYRLVVAGSRGWRDEEIFSTVRELHLADHVVFARRVGQYDLRWLYNACRMYINPSLYEGFGLPLLEAMACGAACLAAATSSLPEIGGDAAIYVPPLDAGLWADAIAELWDDEERRAELGRRGRVQAQRFSWLRAARETLQVYRRAVEGRTPLIAPPPAAVSAGTVPQTLAVPLSALGESHCPRCGTAWFSAQLTADAHVQPEDMALPAQELDRDAKLCPKCGRVQLQARTVQPAETPAAASTEPAPPEPLLMPSAAATEPQAAERGAEEAAEPETPSIELPHHAGEAFQPADQHTENGVEAPDIAPPLPAEPPGEAPSLAEEQLVAHSADGHAPELLAEPPLGHRENGALGGVVPHDLQEAAAGEEAPHSEPPAPKSPSSRSSRRKKSRTQSQ
jgi:glycosyltransferase involved in cell wall biosynthesis/ribosomal protein S27AE